MASSPDSATRPRGRPRLLLGLALLLAGLGILVFGWPDFSSDAFHYEKLGAIRPADAGLTDSGGPFPPEALDRYRIGRGAAAVSLHVAAYRDAGGEPRRAIVYPPPAAPLPAAVSGEQWRHDLWQKAGAAIRTHTDANALFVTWWDNAQRVHFLSGRSGFAERPVAGAFSDGKVRAFWREAAGGFAADAMPLRQLAGWLSMDADRALAEMAEQLPKDRPVFLLVCLDDLARLSEMEALSGSGWPLEARFFPEEANFHGRISQVKHWAGESNYLLQPVPGAGLRVWRTLSPDADKTLLVRLLPFVRSAADWPRGVKLVYQSEQGGYLGIFRLEGR